MIQQQSFYFDSDHNKNDLFGFRTKQFIDRKLNNHKHEVNKETDLIILQIGKQIKTKTNKQQFEVFEGFRSLRRDQSLFYPNMYTLYLQAVVIVRDKPYYVIVDLSNPEDVLFSQSQSVLTEAYKKTLQQISIKLNKRSPSANFKKKHQQITYSYISFKIEQVLKKDLNLDVHLNSLIKKGQIRKKLQNKIISFLDKQTKNRNLKKLKLCNLLMGRYDPKHVILIKLSKRIDRIGQRYQIKKTQNIRSQLKEAINDFLILTPSQKQKYALVIKNTHNNFYQEYRIQRRFMSLSSNEQDKQYLFQFKSVLDRKSQKGQTIIVIDKRNKKNQQILIKTEDFSQCMQQFFIKLLQYHNPADIEYQFNQLIIHQLNKVNKKGFNPIIKSIYLMQMCASIPSSTQSETQQVCSILKIQYTKQRFQTNQIDLINGLVFMTPLT